MRIALFGGTFDPPHRGHLAVARAAAEQFQLETIFFAPAARQPLKADLPAAAYDDRLAMAALCCGEDERFAVSNLDAPRADGQANYTVDTLQLLRELVPAATLFNLVGADSFHDLARWREPRRLLQLAEWVVVSRPGHALADPAGMTLTIAQRSRVHLLDNVHEEIAATGLRERLRTGEPCDHLLPAAVARYIAEHELYRAENAAP